MNSRSTWVWLVIAAGLAAFLLFIEPRLRPPPSTPQPVLPGFNARGVTNIIIQPLGGLEIRANGTNGAWRLHRPVEYPAVASGPGALLAALEKLMPDAVIGGREARQRPEGIAAFGLEPAQVALTLYGDGTRYQVLFGARTAPGDQVFVQVVGSENVYVVPVDILKLVPTVAAPWRDPALVNLRSLALNRITVTNGPTLLELQLVSTNQTWRMIRPRAQRVNSERMADLIANLVKLRAREFVTDDPAADLEALGLQPPALSVAFRLGTNLTMMLHFGKNPTNDAKLVYARMDGLPTVVTVDGALLAPWLAPVNEYRDRQLLPLEALPDVIELQGGETFALERQLDQSWAVAGQKFPVDPAAAGEILTTLTNLIITNFVQDVVIDAELPKFGLAPPVRTINLWRRATGTNLPLASLAFGSQQEGHIHVRRADEDSIYEVAAAGFAQLPVKPLQLRQRRLWSFTEDQVDRITATQQGRSRTLIRQGTNSWALAPGSQGEIFSEAVEETVHRLGDLSVLAWVGRGEADRTRLGFDAASLGLVIELKNGTKHTLSFGGPSPAGYPCVAVTLEGEPWIGEVPIGVHYLVRTHLGLGESAR